RGYPGWEPLIWIGCAMAVYGVIYALIESDMRRILAYAIINQVGFMVCAAGVGTHEAISGATAAAFCHILYKSLLWMATGVVLYRLGKSQLSELGGLYRTMPVTTLFFLIGCLSMAVPGTCGFTSKNIIIHAVEHEHLFWPWLILEICAVGIFLAVAIRLPYFLFFGKDKGLRPSDAPRTMIGGMALLGSLCLFFGIIPSPLYDLLPFEIDYHPYKLAKVVIVLQWAIASGIAFFFLRKWLAPKPGILLDFDWFYRKGSIAFYRAADTTLNGANALTKRVFLEGFVAGVCHFFESGASRACVWVMTPIWMLQGHKGEEIEHLQQSIFKRSQRGAFPIGITAFCAVILLGILSVILLIERP
ncbi:MAG: proton-conducting transporter membrane subunit, partial [Verrucomicrobiota bacterium]